MATKIHKKKRLSQLNLDRLVAVRKMAEHFCDDECAKALAVGALERLNQSGFICYANKIRSIRLGTATVGQHKPETYDRLVAGRRARKLAIRLERREKYGDLWSPIGQWELDLLDISKPVPPRFLND